MPTRELDVIIPCYNVKEYIADCLMSVFPLPEGSACIHCVDDGSADGTDALLAELVRRREGVRLHSHRENKGLSAARNTGLKHARGEYVLFVDSDDLLRAEAVLPLLRQARENRLDILQAAYECFEDGTDAPVPAPPMARATDVLTGDACLARMCREGTYEPMTVIRIYRAGFLNQHGLRFAEGQLFEDELFTAEAFLRAERVQVSDALLYRYRQREGSIMSGFRRSANWCEQYLRVVRRLTAMSKAEHPTPGQLAVRRRAAAIALSIPKNIAAYGLEGEVRRQAIAFARAHRAEIAACAAHSGAATLWAQGTLLRASLPLFLRLYAWIAGHG